MEPTSATPEEIAARPAPRFFEFDAIAPRPPGQDALTPGELSRLRWRSRRGLLENDLFIAHFFDHYGNQLTVSQANGLYALMDLTDNDLLDLHLGRKELAEVAAKTHPDLNTQDVQNVLNLLKTKAKT